MTSQSTKKTNYVYFVSIITLIIGLLSYGIALASQSQSNKNETPKHSYSHNKSISEEANKETKPPEPVSFKASMTYFGDVFWGRYVHDWSLASDEKYNFPFQGLSQLTKNDNDYWIANLECPITNQSLSSQLQERDLKFNCTPEYLPYAKKYFDAFGLANNHTDNMEEFDGLASTRRYLEDYSIAHFGHYDNKIDQICTIVPIPLTPYYNQNDKEESIQSDTQITPSYSMPVALCAFHSVFRVLTQDEINVISDYASYMPTIAFPHSGKEYVLTPDAIKTTTYRSMVDQGALAVIGGHPHALQSTEVYKQKLIAYSLGNFIFDQQSGQMTTSALAINSIFEIPYSETTQIWQTLPKSCYNTSIICEQIKSIKTKPQFKTTYTPIFTVNSKKIARPANQQEIDYILKVTNIDKTLTELNK